MSILTFGSAYMSVVLIEPLLDLAVLAAAKHLTRLRHSALLEKRLYQVA
ncbi:hypothetical protein ALO71_02953 [Pseudomonas amygdali pv. dendropanacis]|uniref:Uncharacterized protein n=1 Tax=Pseudomonas amygdali pv. dendropanacis TaxID=235272 RepID=A0A0P9PY89_PSEA0|nr:hypothetical protein ALO71_02953 [Pseudomonas amygdali pv. dendropanacis]